jgi:PAS domain S-box-containing protein
MHITAQPIFGNGATIGAVTFAYGTPPRDFATLQKIAKQYQVTEEELRQQAHDARSCPGALVDRAKHRLKTAARSIGEIVQRKRAEERFRATFEQTAVGMAHIAPDGRLLRVNQQFCDILGYTRQEMEGLTIRETTHPDDLGRDLDHMRQLLAGKNPTCSREKRYVHKDHSVVYVRVSLSVLQKSTGQPKYLVSVVQDLAGQRRVKQEAKRLQERFAGIYHSSRDGVSFATLGGILVDVNEAFCQLVGYSKEELIASKTYEDLTPEEYRPFVRSQVKSLITTGAPQEYEKIYLRKDGRGIPVEVTTFLVRDTEDRPLGIAAISKDITERQKAMAALEKSEKRYRLVVDNMADLLVKIDVEGRFLFVSPSYCELFGKGEEELLGNKFMPLVHEEDREATAMAMEALLRPPHKAYMEQRALTKKGWRWLAWSDKAVLDEHHNVVAVVGVGRDITQAKDLERKLQQAQKMEAIGTLAGGIAHDFNNLLSAIMGYAEMAKEDAANEALVRHDVGEVLKAGTRARDLVKQILTFSRQSEHELRPLQVKPIVKEALKLLRASLPTTIEIRQDIRSEAIVMADPTQVHQILMNLCTNAGYAMQEEGGILEVRLTDTELDAQYTGVLPGSYLELTVRDTGTGMDVSTMKQMFDPYFTTKEKGQGTGLGLSVVHGIVTSCGGAIRVYSEVGKGSIFHVYLPVKEGVEKGEDVVEESLPLGTERILFIDDEPFMVNLQKRALESLGYSVVARTSSLEALEAFRAAPERFDLVITDMTMPHMTGEKLAREMIKIRSDIPVILCSGFSPNMTEQKAKALGIRAFVAKPLLKRDLAMTIREVLDAK